MTVFDPPNYAFTIHAQGRWGNLFYHGEHAVLTFASLGPFVGAPFGYNGTYEALGDGASGVTFIAQRITGLYYVRDYFGVEVTRGTLTDQSSVDLGILACGFYKLFLTQTVDISLGPAGIGGRHEAGTGTFSVVPFDPHFPTVIGDPVYALGEWQGSPTLTAQNGNVGFGGSPHFHALTGQMDRLPGIQKTETWDTDPPSAGPNEKNKARDYSQARLHLSAKGYMDPAFQDPVRPRVIDYPYLQGSDTEYTSADAPGPRAGTTAATADLAANFDIRNFVLEGPRNEEQGSGPQVVTAIVNWSNAVIAGSPLAFKIAYGQVEIGPNYLPQLTYVYNALGAMSPCPIDGVSFHGYGATQGDLSLARLVFSNFEAMLQTAGLASLPRFSTEQGWGCVDSSFTNVDGFVAYHRGGEYDMLMLLIYEQHGVPKEHHYHWTVGSSGNGNYIITRDRNHLPQLTIEHRYAAEIWGKRYAAALDFGDIGNDMLIGNRYDDPFSGDSVYVIMGVGLKDGQIQFTATGASAFWVADCFGNETSVATSSGILTITVPLQPIYIRAPHGTSLTLIPKWTSTKLVRSLAVEALLLASGSTANRPNLSRITDGAMNDAYYVGGPEQQGRNSVFNPYIDDTRADVNAPPSPWSSHRTADTTPAWLTLSFPKATRVDEVLIWCCQLYQSYGTMIDFDVQYWDGAAWVVAQTVTTWCKSGTVDDTTANVVLFRDLNGWQTSSEVHSFMEGRWIFDVTFAPLTTTALRIYVRDATYGGCPTIEAQNTMIGDFGTFGSNFTIREVKVFDSDLGVERIVLL